MATLTINTETLTNDQVAQLVAILSTAAATAYEQSQQKGDDAAAAKWDADWRNHMDGACNAFRELIDRVGIEEAADLCDAFGADPEFC